MNLLMLTKFYPFGTGEAFIENEIKTISENYERVLIVACEVPKNVTSVRSLPDNISVVRIDAKVKLLDIIGGIPYWNSKEECIRKECNNRMSIIRRVFLGYFEAKSNRIYKFIMQATEYKEFIKTPFVLYSYWLFMTARVGILISESSHPVYKFSRAHGYDLYEELNSLQYLPFRDQFLTEYNRVFPCSDYGSKYLREKYPRYKNKIQTAFLGTVDHGVGVSGGKGEFKIVSCSRMHRLKRVHLIAEAVKLLNTRDIRIEWIHIGDGDDFNKIKRIVEHNKTNIKMTLAGGISNREVLKYYMDTPIDLFVNVSSSEGLPVSIMEAISFGIPVLATDVGGTSEIVVEGISGTLLGKNPTIGQIAEAIQRFIDAKQYNSTEYNKYRNNCRELWEKRFVAHDNYRKLYKEIEEAYNDTFSDYTGL